MVAHARRGLAGQPTQRGADVIPLAWVLDFVQAQWRPLAGLWGTIILLIVYTVRGHERNNR